MNKKGTNAVIGDVDEMNCMVSRSVDNVDNTNNTKIREVFHMAHLGDTSKCITNTKERIKTKFYYNSRVKPAAIDASLARRPRKYKALISNDQVVRSKTFLGGSLGERQ